MTNVDCIITEGGTINATITKDLEINIVGIGVPKGGTAGQFLMKIDDSDYNTQWTINIDGGTF